MYEGVKTEVLSTTEYDKNSDLSTTYLGRINMISVKGQNVFCTSVKVHIGLGILYLACRQLRFSLYSRAVTTKALTVVVLLLLSLVSGSVEYPMPYASCLVSCSVVWRCSLQLSLSLGTLHDGALLVQGFGLLQPLLSRVFLHCTLG